MSVQLTNLSKNLTVVHHVITANTIWSRLKGLLGRDSFDQDATMWFPHSNSIHTFFMNFPIDVAFVDKNFKVKALYKNVKPGRLIWPVWSARSVFEFASGAVDNKIEIGDQLNVGH